MRARRGAAVLAARIPDTGTPPPPPPPPVGDTFIDEFGAPSGTPPNSVYWNVSAKSAGSTMVQDNGQLLMQGGDLGGFSDYQYLQLGATYVDFDMRVSFYMTNDSITQHYPRIGWHGSGTQTSSVVQTSGYTLEISVFYQYWQVSRRNAPSGSETEFPGAQTVGWGTNDLVHARIQVTSNMHRVKVWRNAEPEPPDWQFERSDAIYPSGVMWLSHQASGPDNYVRWERIEVQGTPLAPGEPPPPPPPNLAPTDISLSNAAVEANSTSPRGVGTFTASDPNFADIGDTHTFSLVPGPGNTDNNLFTIVGNQLRCATDVGSVGTRSIRVRTTDQGGLTFEKVFTITITAAGAYLTTKAAILAAFQGGQQTIRIGHGVYTFGAGEALKLTVPNQTVIAQPGGIVQLQASVPMNEYGSTGVIQVESTAPFAEVSGDGSTFIITQTVNQATWLSPGENRPCVGMHVLANDWYIHDIIVKNCSHGYAVWSGSGTFGGVRRLHRCMAILCGYRGPTFGHSGYGIYMQTPNVNSSVTIDINDFAVQEQTDFGMHDYASFTMDAPRVLNGILICNTGSALPTGSGGGPTCVYLAKSEDLETHHNHFYMNVSTASTHWALNKVGYGSGIFPERFVATDSWFCDRSPSPLGDNSRWLMNASPPYPIFDRGVIMQWANTAHRAQFSGVKPLGATWFVCYGTVPAGYEQVPQSIAYPSVGGMPALTLVRAV